MEKKRRKNARARVLAAASFPAAALGPRPAQGVPPIVASGLIAFVREAPRSGIYTMTPTGSALTRLTDGEDYRPRWSPDGTRIVFQRFEGARSYVYVMDADGGNLQRLTTRTGFQPAWSPDGTRIVFGTGIGTREEIFVMNADGSNLIRLTSNHVKTFCPRGLRMARPSRSRAIGIVTGTCI